MGKVAINTCFGGFGISPEAFMRLVRQGSSLIERVPAKEYYGGNNPNFAKGWEQKWADDKAGAQTVDGMLVHRLYNLAFDGDDILLENVRSDENRSHPDLIAVIEEMGKAVNGPFSDLRIIDVPDGVGWEISEYDGNEHIAEAHRTWR